MSQRISPLSETQIHSEQVRLFGQAVTMTAEKAASFKRLYKAVDHLYTNDFDPNQSFDFPHYGGLPARISTFLSPEAVDAIQDVLPLLARMEKPSRDQWLSLVLRRASELGDFPLSEEPSSIPSASRRKPK